MLLQHDRAWPLGFSSWCHSSGWRCPKFLQCSGLPIPRLEPWLCHVPGCGAGVTGSCPAPMGAVVGSALRSTKLMALAAPRQGKATGCARSSPTPAARPNPRSPGRKMRGKSLGSLCSWRRSWERGSLEKSGWVSQGESGALPPAPGLCCGRHQHRLGGKPGPRTAQPAPPQLWDIGFSKGSGRREKTSSERVVAALPGSASCPAGSCSEG